VTTTKKDGNGDANEALLRDFFQRGLAQLEELAKTDPEQARALAQAWVERIKEILER
jgi:hypothetical protein